MVLLPAPWMDSCCTAVASSDPVEGFALLIWTLPPLISMAIWSPVPPVMVNEPRLEDRRNRQQPARFQGFHAQRPGPLRKGRAAVSLPRPPLRSAPGHPRRLPRILASHGRSPE